MVLFRCYPRCRLVRVRVSQQAFRNVSSDPCDNLNHINLQHRWGILSTFLLVLSAWSGTHTLLDLLIWSACIFLYILKLLLQTHRVQDTFKAVIAVFDHSDSHLYCDQCRLLVFSPSVWIYLQYHRVCVFVQSNLVLVYNFWWMGSSESSEINTWSVYW